VQAVLRPLLQPHLEDLADKLQPGLLVLTWTSMNIDGYLHRFHQVGGCCQAAGLVGVCAAGLLAAWLLAAWLALMRARGASHASSAAILPHAAVAAAHHPPCLPACLPALPCLQCLARTEELVRQAGDILGSRIQANLAAVAAARLLDLPPDQTFTYEEFVAQQVGGWVCWWVGAGWAGELGSVDGWQTKLECGAGGAARRQPGCSGRCPTEPPASLQSVTRSPHPPPLHLRAPQSRHIKRQAEALAVRNQEVQRSCEELLDLVASWPRENAGAGSGVGSGGGGGSGAAARLAPEAANLFRDYCSRSMYQVGVASA
jgi:hypothetical protein